MRSSLAGFACRVDPEIVRGMTANLSLGNVEIDGWRNDEAQAVDGAARPTRALPRDGPVRPRRAVTCSPRW